MPVAAITFKRETMARQSDCERPDTGFARGQSVGTAVQSLVGRVVVFAKGAERFFTGPAVDGQVASGDIGIAQQLGASILRRQAKQLRPDAVGSISCFEGGDLLFSHFKLPYDDEHVWIQAPALW